MPIVTTFWSKCLVWMVCPPHPPTPTPAGDRSRGGALLSITDPYLSHRKLFKRNLPAETLTLCKMIRLMLFCECVFFFCLIPGPLCCWGHEGLLAWLHHCRPSLLCGSRSSSLSRSTLVALEVDVHNPVTCHSCPQDGR